VSACAWPGGTPWCACAGWVVSAGTGALSGSAALQGASRPPSGPERTEPSRASRAEHRLLPRGRADRADRAARRGGRADRAVRAGVAVEQAERTEQSEQSEQDRRAPSEQAERVEPERERVGPSTEHDPRPRASATWCSSVSSGSARRGQCGGQLGHQGGRAWPRAGPRTVRCEGDAPEPLQRTALHERTEPGRAARREVCL